MSEKDYLVIQDVKKSFSGVPVLKGVSFSMRQGEVHGLLGGNGAGKSTLMNIIGGLYTKDEGTIYIDGKEADISSPKKAEMLGIGFIHQELKLFDLRSVAENIMMSNIPTKKPLGFVDDKKMQMEAQKWLDMIGLDIKASTPLGDLSIAEQQQVEIAKALSLNARIIIFDEPTSSLTTGETQVLFSIIRKLKEDGACIIYISHKFDEIFDICDRVTVLRDGVVTGTLNTSETNDEELVNLVIGRKLEAYFPELPPAPDENSEVVLEVKDFVNSKLRNVSLQLRKGEILGLFGLVGAGRSELCRAIFGLDYVQSGQLLLHGEKVKISNPKSAIKHSISFLTEDRRKEGLVLKLDIKRNLTLPIINRIKVPAIGLVKFKQENSLVKDAFERFSIKATGPKQRVSRLSGGNQQKVVLSKWFMTNSEVLILDEPTRGVDVGAKAEIYEMIVKRVKENGLSVILISSEAPEIMGMSHRILAMNAGRIVGEYQHGEATEEELIGKCAGG